MVPMDSFPTLTSADFRFSSNTAFSPVANINKSLKTGDASEIPSVKNESEFFVQSGMNVLLQDTSNDFPFYAMINAFHRPGFAFATYRGRVFAPTPSPLARIWNQLEHNSETSSSLQLKATYKTFIEKGRTFRVRDVLESPSDEVMKEEQELWLNQSTIDTAQMKTSAFKRNEGYSYHRSAIMNCVYKEQSQCEDLEHIAFLNSLNSDDSKREFSFFDDVDLQTEIDFEVDLLLAQDTCSLDSKMTENTSSSSNIVAIASKRQREEDFTEFEPRKKHSSEKQLSEESTVDVNSVSIKTPSDSSNTAEKAQKRGRSSDDDNVLPAKKKSIEKTSIENHASRSVAPPRIKLKLGPNPVAVPLKKKHSKEDSL
ncbi:hypothetical protein HDU79_004465 [Rhizoclosmatium sp. JEL0117]|nr:hypothetical protein HDU79_004465 [Rhizoclosmatium sp. JEL0117]